MIVVLLAIMNPIRANAETGDRYRINGSDNLIAVGGYNQYDEIKVFTQEDALALEARMKTDGYIQVSGEGRVISDEEYNLIMQENEVWYYHYKDSYNVKIFIYKPVYDDYIEYKANGLTVPIVTLDELMTSSVVLDYFNLEQIELSGTYDNQVGDAIPSHFKAGWIEIHSPIDCEIVLWNDESNRYYSFLIEKNTPFKEKLKCGSYRLVEINKLAVQTRIDNEGEDTLPYNNRIQIGDWNTEDNPYLLDFTNITIKYRLTDINKEEYVPKENVPYIVPTEQIKVIKGEEETVIEKAKKVFNGKTFGIILFVLIIALLIAYAIIIIRKNKNGASDDDEYIR